MKATVAALQKQNNELQAHIDALESDQIDPSCPPGYLKSPKPAAAFLPASVVCARGVDEVVKVDVGRAAFWIDRYEATIWDALDGSGAQHFGGGVDDSTIDFPKNGYASTPLFALSVPGTYPAASVTWFQAAAACAASGKGLPTNYHWQRAVAGTTDSGTVAGNAADEHRCNTQSATARVTGGGIGDTSETSCVSRWGAEDMIGNLSEWVQEWDTAVGDTGAEVAGKQMWPDDPTHPYGEDGTWNIASKVFTETSGVVSNLPAAVARGGTFLGGVRAGAFSYGVNNPPSGHYSTFGFRCIVR
ncbi:MAG: SUMF1/EgtB/PvdO family nonheme iron enzyme [Polyangiaceae bacterium]